MFFHVSKWRNRRNLWTPLSVIPFAFKVCFTRLGCLDAGGLFLDLLYLLFFWVSMDNFLRNVRAHLVSISGTNLKTYSVLLRVIPSESIFRHLTREKRLIMMLWDWVLSSLQKDLFWRASHCPHSGPIDRVSFRHDLQGDAPPKPWIESGGRCGSSLSTGKRARPWRHCSTAKTLESGTSKQREALSSTRRVSVPVKWHYAWAVARDQRKRTSAREWTDAVVGLRTVMA